MSLERIIEEQIRKAIEAGEFDDLSGKGKPLDLEGYFQTPQALRMGYSVLKSGHFVPPEVELLKQIEELKIQHQSCRDSDQRQQLQVLIREKTLNVNVLLENQRRKK